MTSICPYCNNDTGKVITMKKKCPVCTKVIFVRNGKVVTDEEKFIIDWQKYMDFMVPDIEALRFDVEKTLEARFGKEPGAPDLIWGMFNQILLKLSDPWDLSIIYRNMAKFRQSEGNKDAYIKLMKTAMCLEVRDSAEKGWANNIVIKNIDDGLVCDECKIINGKIYPVKEALANFPLPHNKCTSDACRCTYLTK